MIQRGEIIEDVHGEVLFTEEDISEAVRKVATFVLDNYERPPLCVPLLNGAGPFALDVVTDISRLEPGYHPPLDYMIVRTYHGEDPLVPAETRIIRDLSPETIVSNQKVLVLDDILDTGGTMEFTTTHLESAGAADVQIGVLVDRVIPKDVQALIAGIKTEDKRWLVGKGMDDPKALGPDGGRYLPYIAAALSQPGRD
jgi:hypoxanthine phosphoribosyltransferase